MVPPNPCTQKEHPVDHLVAPSAYILYRRDDDQQTDNGVDLFEANASIGQQKRLLKCSSILLAWLTAAGETGGEVEVEGDET